MANAVTMSLSGGVAEINIEYLPSNLKITDVSWAIQVGYAGTVRVWDTNISTVTPIFESTFGSGVGAAKIPGTYQLVWVNDPELGDYLTMPPNIRYIMTLRSV